MKRSGIRVLIIFMAATLMLAPVSEARPAGEINAAADTVLSRFTTQVKGAQELLSTAKGVLVFPDVIKAGAGVGAEFGEGALRIRGRTDGYYNIISASIGFQLGVQTRSVIVMFMTPEALDSFERKDGWKVGVDGSVAIVTVGVGGSIDTNRIRSPVIGFILDPKGLMYNLTLEGSKISRMGGW